MTLTAILIVPTGIGAEIGGYAGDALPVARVLAQVCDRLITHPNVLNGAQLYWPQPNLFYVEGYGLDRFAAGDWGLRPVRRNRVGLVLDAAIEPELRLRHLQAADAVRATLGLELADWILTDAPLEVQVRSAPSGASWGTIGNPDSLLRAADRSLKDAKADAIAVVARFPDESGPTLDDYRHGTGVDAIAGAEAVISHLVVRQFQVPCAHAPALAPLPADPEVSPRAAAEELGYTFLPCVLVGLSRAPRFVSPGRSRPQDIWAEDIDAIVAPATACGSSAILSLSCTQARLVAVDSATQMQATPEALGLRALHVSSYLEAAGVLAAYRAGVDPSVFNPHLLSIFPHPS